VACWSGWTLLKFKVDGAALNEALSPHGVVRLHCSTKLSPYLRWSSGRTGSRQDYTDMSNDAMTLRHELTGKQAKWKAGDAIERPPQRAHLTSCTK
jgi:hypothetical protein